MKLSEALRLGEFALPPTYNRWYEREQESGKVCGACAVGRLAVAAGYSPRVVEQGMVDDEQSLSKFFSAQWPWTAKHHTLQSWTEPVNGIMAAISKRYEGSCEITKGGEIARVGQETMRQIADWVATIEPQERTEPQPQVIDEHTTPVPQPCTTL